MKLVRQGLRSKEIARELGISPRTVDQHIAAAMENLGVRNRLAAVSRMRELEKLESELKSPAQPPTPFMLGGITLPPASPPHSPNLSFSENGVQKFAAPPKNPQRTDARRAPAFPPIGGVSNTSQRTLRLNWIIRIAILSVMVSCGLILSILAIIELAGKTA